MPTINPDDPLVIAALLGLGAGLALGLIIAGIAGMRARARRDTRIAVLETKLQDQGELANERAAALDLAEDRLAASFAAVSDRSLQANSDAFLRLAREHLGAQRNQADAGLAAREKAVEALVAPIAAALDKTQAQIAAIEKERGEAYGGIRSELQAVHLAHQGLQAETRRLVTALRRPQVRGQWGELTLRRLVELAGMVEHCDFQEQAHTRTGDGAIRPDLVVSLPDERQLVVDVKTPLEAYLDAVEATDDESRASALQRHARNVREHMRLLAGKQYWSQFPKSPDFVILFIPGDQFLSAALGEDERLLEDALRNKIILATPTSFVALLKAVAYGWNQSRLAAHADTIRALAEELHHRLGSFCNHLAAVGRHLDSSVAAYNRAVGSMERKVLPGARKFAELGVQERAALATMEPLERGVRELAGAAMTQTGAAETPDPQGSAD